MASGIKVRRNKKFKATTDSNHSFNIAPNLLNRDFSADRPNQKWAGDISYVGTREGWLYLAVILDLHSRRVIGWAVSNRMKRDLAIRALNMAIALRQPPKGRIHHTDRGSQYCSHDYQKILRQHGFKVSMSGKGNCYEFKDGLRIRSLPSRPSSRRSRPSCCGSGRGRRAERQSWRSSNTSTASTIRAADTQPWAGKAPWPSRLRPHK